MIDSPGSSARETSGSAGTGGATGAHDEGPVRDVASARGAADTAGADGGAAGVRRVARGDAAYHAAVRDPLFNRLVPGGTPDAVAYPQSEADLVALVSAARDSGEKLALRSGGHSWVAASVRDDGLLVDLAAFDQVSIDTTARTATVGPAVRGGELGQTLVAVDLAFPVGHCGRPGVGGFLLGGGLGLNWGQWLPSCFSIRSMRVVLASGEVVTASATENADLFWLARGSGPGFPGIVTEFELDLRPLPRDIRLSSWTFDLAHVEAVTEWVSRAVRTLPASVEVSVVLQGPERPDGPATAGGDPDAPTHVVSVVAISYTDTEAEAREAFAALDEGPGPGIRPSGHTDRLSVAFDELHVGVDATYPDGHRYLADTFWSPRDLGDLLPRLADLLRRAPSGKTYFLSAMPGHGEGRTLLPVGEAAYGMHDTSLIVPYVIWGDEADDAVNRAWLNEVKAMLEPLSSGHFLSEADLRFSPERSAGSFRTEDWARIQSLTELFDPTGVFHRYPLA
ncbi:FAD-binding oxidoreductase [Subtercola boreus]|uniref:FAD-binding oxidoreductase n=1 Tax=Subtercola boreus TaxID=120213 RepID=UPI0011C0609A|nr:FAD-binding oxidoreductase [Subtercola boreus]